MEAIGNFMDTGDTDELEWVVENTECHVCRVHTKTALVLWEEGYEDLAMRNLEFAIEALKGMLDRARKGVEDGIGSDHEGKA